MSLVVVAKSNMGIAVAGDSRRSVLFEYGQSDFRRGYYDGVEKLFIPPSEPTCGIATWGSSRLGSLTTPSLLAAFQNSSRNGMESVESYAKDLAKFLAHLEVSARGLPMRHMGILVAGHDKVDGSGHIFLLDISEGTDEDYTFHVEVSEVLAGDTGLVWFGSKSILNNLLIPPPKLNLTVTTTGGGFQDSTRPMKNADHSLVQGINVSEAPVLELAGLACSLVQVAICVSRFIPDLQQVGGDVLVLLMEANRTSRRYVYLTNPRTLFSVDGHGGPSTLVT